MNVEVMYEDGGIEYQVSADVQYHVEKNWGSDADGKKGIRRVFVDDVEYDDIEVFDIAKDEWLKDMLFGDLPEKVQMEIEEMVEEEFYQNL